MEFEADEFPGYVLALWSDHKKDEWYKLEADVSIGDSGVAGDITLTIRGLKGTDFYSCSVNEFQILQRSIRIGEDRIPFPGEVIVGIQNYFSPVDLEDRATEV